MCLEEVTIGSVAVRESGLIPKWQEGCQRDIPGAGGPNSPSQGLDHPGRYPEPTSTSGGPPIATEPTPPLSLLPAPIVAQPRMGNGPLAERFQRLEARLKDLDALAAANADERAILAREMASVEAELLANMDAARVRAVRLPDRAWLVQTPAPRAVIPLWEPNQFPTELRRETLEIDTEAIRAAIGDADYLLNEDGIEIARLEPTRMRLEIRYGDL